MPDRVIQFSACIVGWNIDPTVRVLQIIDGAVDLVGIAEISLQEDCGCRGPMLGKLANRFAGCRSVAVHQHDVGALGLKTFGDCPADTLRTAGDESHSASKFS